MNSDGKCDSKSNLSSKNATNILEILKTIKQEVGMLINDIDEKIDETEINVNLTVKEIKELLILLKSGCREEYRYEYYYYGFEHPLIEKIEKLINK